MDHISKALEKAQTESGSVRSWVKPSAADQTKAPLAQLAARSVRLEPSYLAARHLLHGPGLEDPVVADRYRLLRTQLLKRMQANGWSQLGITSCGPRSGKTLTAINLAISMARDENQRVVIIDADLRKSTMAGDLGLGGTGGLIDYLSGAAELEAIAAIPEQIPNLFIVPGRRVESSDSTPELLASSRMTSLLRQFRHTREPTITIVDLPPVVVGDDVISVAGQLDAMLLVVEEGGTDVDELQEAAEMLAEFNLLGTVLNKSTQKNKDVAGYYQAASRRTKPGKRSE